MCCQWAVPGVPEAAVTEPLTSGDHGQPRYIHFGDFVDSFMHMDRCVLAGLARCTQAERSHA